MTHDVPAVADLSSARSSQSKQTSYGRILKSSALVGGSTALDMLFRVIRTKALALLLGPSGVGLLGIYSSISELVRSIAGLGINSSGVRQIAESISSGNARRTSCTIRTLRRIAFYSGTLGALLLIALARPLSDLTFKDYEHAGAISLLALAAFLLDISDAQRALVQGMRRIGDLARMNILGALYATVFSTAIVYFWRERGIVPSLVCVAAMSILTSWWYARKVALQPVQFRWKEAFAEASELVKLGVVVMASGLSTLLTMYVVRLLILRNMGLRAAGLYQAAWGLAGLCIHFILDAMGTDFYPRLTAVAGNRTECNRLVNEQIEVGFLMATPAVLAALSLAPLVITLFYSSTFGGAVELLRWLCVGMFLRTITWPMGFILLAKAERQIFFWTGLLTNLAYIILVWMGVSLFGLTGVGIAFFILQSMHSIVIYLTVRHLTTFSWSVSNKRLAWTCLPPIALIFGLSYVLPSASIATFGVVLTTITGYFSIRTLCRLISLDQLPQGIRRIVLLARMGTSYSAEEIG